MTTTTEPTTCQYLVTDRAGVLHQCGEIVRGYSLWARGKSYRCASHVYARQHETVPTIFDADCENCGQPHFAHIAPNDTACRVYDARPDVSRMINGTVLETRTLGGAR